MPVGLNAIALAAQLLRAGEFDIVVAGGMESMTRPRTCCPRGAPGASNGPMELLDAMARDGLSDAFDHTPMGELTGVPRLRPPELMPEATPLPRPSSSRAEAAREFGVGKAVTDDEGEEEGAGEGEIVSGDV